MSLDMDQMYQDNLPLLELQRKRCRNPGFVAVICRIDRKVDTNVVYKEQGNLLCHRTMLHSNCQNTTIFLDISSERIH